ncbi:putative iron export permease protein FetB [Methanosarcinaceae archaeon Ag5]|uniref:Iron export permease protein FetB n=1 Tax=Methanolapillus africanus TaxID=3028297 RepID=A0AAE4SDG4_9EURY|nr:putative iron export permease protein FetB [Methanosarcinaceae archaeon Ag5]
MDNVVVLNFFQFALIYLLLLIVLAIMKLSKAGQSKQIILASMTMTVQLILAGLILSYIFKNPNPVFVAVYVAAMIAFSIWRVLSKNKGLNKRFKIAVAVSIAFSGLFVVVYFVGIVVGISLFNPQYVIPISGMVFGNTMTGVGLALKTFDESLKSQRLKMDVLLNLGAAPKKILRPFANNALETALLPTINSMFGMGIVSLPGMMTGQILAGTDPFVAILYQIAIMISICTAVCLSVYLCLEMGYRTLYNKKGQFEF